MPNSTTAIRNKALVVVLFRGGLRISEALALRPADITGNSINVLHGKGNKQRMTALDPEAAAILGQWLDAGGRLGISNHSTVFCTHAGKRFLPSYIRSMLTRLGKRAGIERLHAHGLRHGFASTLAEQNVSIPIISAALGHSNIATTNTYLQHVQPREVIAAVSNSTW